eukprot:scaffold64115_cov65-Phaeocystis_antarctica.AAC.4
MRVQRRHLHHRSNRHEPRQRTPEAKTELTVCADRLLALQPLKALRPTVGFRKGQLEAVGVVVGLVRVLALTPPEHEVCQERALPLRRTAAGAALAAARNAAPHVGQRRRRLQLQAARAAARTRVGAGRRLCRRAGLHGSYGGGVELRGAEQLQRRLEGGETVAEPAEQQTLLARASREGLDETHLAQQLRHPRAC